MALDNGSPSGEKWAKYLPVCIARVMADPKNRKEIPVSGQREVERFQG